MTDDAYVEPPPWDPRPTHVASVPIWYDRDGRIAVGGQAPYIPTTKPGAKAYWFGGTPDFVLDKPSAAALAAVLRVYIEGF